MPPIDTKEAEFYNVSEEKLIEFLEYRKEIKKPIKTQRAVNLCLSQALSCSRKLGIIPDRAFDITMENEWQGVKLEYVRNHLQSVGELKDAKQLNQAGPGRSSLADRIRAGSN